MVEPIDPAIAHLAAIDADFARLIASVGPCGLKPKPEREPYEGLIRSIAYQQLHARAAEAIFGRFLALYPNEAFPSPTSILATDEQVIRACGFSTAKVAAIRGIAAAACAWLTITAPLATTARHIAAFQRLRRVLLFFMTERSEFMVGTAGRSERESIRL